MKNFGIYLMAVILVIAGTASGYEDSYIKRLPQKEIEIIGELVFKNECASKDENIIAWNEGEDFMSLGIGHFIWYPAGSKDGFEESFPRFLKYAKASGERLPVWLDKTPQPACPWRSREEFMASSKDKRLAELRKFLTRTKTLQSAFIIKRLDDALPLILKSIPKEKRERIALRFNRVAATSDGIYALADYVNFKGLGILASERYQGEGWGLLQVLENMKNDERDALKAFVRSANTVLEIRVKNAPANRDEKRWLPGWQSRINSYLKKLEG
ncbi:MAG: hypothetical protein A4E71_00020 [Smithella sp. PtaU1.Bin162]|nr:MAG: hypothetical protein A4E71_00020 [Smithella sp. PtaU1.Bin162]